MSCAARIVTVLSAVDQDRSAAEPCAPGEENSGIFIGTPHERIAYDYGYDGVMRSHEASLQRLGVERIDILLVHDIDAVTHGSVERSQAHIRALVDGGGWRALDELRGSGAVAAIGAGLNEWELSERLLGLLDPDIFLLAGRYTLLEQTALESFLPACSARGVGVIIGGPFNSGVLATGPVPGAPCTITPLRRPGCWIAQSRWRRSAVGMEFAWPRRRCIFRSVTPRWFRSFPAARRQARYNATSRRWASRFHRRFGRI